MGEKFHLPRGRWVNSSVQSLQGHMTANNTAVVVGMDFFYQSWNHRLSKLPTSNERFRQGLVLAPNDEDRRVSLEKRAGHSILLVGWDDTLSVQQLDENGEPRVDAAGEPIMQTGFWLFKNSWGTGSFGVENEFGAGYGWIAYDYVTGYGSAQVSGLPEVIRDEVCNDGRDNDGDDLVDCDDSDCSGEAACMMPGGTYRNDTAFAIPDNNPAGVASVIEVPAGGAIGALSVTVDIEHTYRGDLRVVLVKDDREVVLHDRDGGGEDHLQVTWPVTALLGEDAAGRWELHVSDHAGADTGTLKSWSLDIVPCLDGDCAGGGGGDTRRYDNTTGADIPVNAPAGVVSEIEIADGGAITALSVGVNITHPYRGDLSIRLERDGGPSVTLLAADGTAEADLVRTFAVDGFAGGDAAGTWRLVVADEAGSDVGRLNSWFIEVTR
jgi:subtilisin-like proprotein convertase family protein